MPSASSPRPRVSSMRLSAGMYRSISQSPLSCSRRRSWSSRGDQRAERERVPREAAARPQRRGDVLEDAPLVGPRRQVDERAERADDEVDRLLERSRACRPRAARRAGRPPARARPPASPASGRCRSRACRSRARSGSRRARCRRASSTIGSPASRASSTYHARPPSCRRPRRRSRRRRSRTRTRGYSAGHAAAPAPLYAAPARCRGAGALAGRFLQAVESGRQPATVHATREEESMTDQGDTVAAMDWETYEARRSRGVGRGLDR